MKENKAERWLKDNHYIDTGIVCEPGPDKRNIAPISHVMEDYAAFLASESCDHQWQEVWKDHNEFQSSWGANRCMKCGEIDEWQYDSPYIKYSS